MAQQRRRRPWSQQKHITTQVAARAALEEIGWEHARTSKKGYMVMRCPCSEHQCALPKTPSNPNRFNELISYQLKQCPWPIDG